jgi:hypothetical protein
MNKFLSSFLVNAKNTGVYTRIALCLALRIIIIMGCG